ncbi:DHA2 family efflux MFS transporter permease subunit [Rhodococcus marinonascens]|uniref:DHA2 family efflux MFS transporter permease subunit n=1 Tax=Rhodococcus marinonascens TaxID=38311 RepID=UPI000934806E|nr:DHA2 family efflux MFS transporter permease subunit [Rhodococcus marinonascens]
MGIVKNQRLALLAVCLGFFVILLDSTIVAVANPSIMASLDTDVGSVVWVTSAYLLAFAVPLLVTGRLGDRFGPKNIYLIGLVVFTLASLWAGLSGSIDMLILARVVQGFGAAMMAPQTMAVITRIFPPDKRGVAMGWWGAVAGVAMATGPVAGGVLEDGLGWQWIFFVNVPIGITTIVLAILFIPTFETHLRRFDLLGVLLSAVGMFLFIFGLQEGHTYDWSVGVWLTIAAGLITMGLFVRHQASTSNDPVVPLGLFRDRYFTVSNIAIAALGWAITSMMVPLMFYAQFVGGLSPTRSALPLLPLGILTAVLALIVGRYLDRLQPRTLAGPGLLLVALGLGWLALAMKPDASVWALTIPMVVVGMGNGLAWPAIASSATRNLPQHQAGAGSGVYNTTRQVGGVIGVAGIGALMTLRLTANGVPERAVSEVGAVPPDLREGFAVAMAQSMLLPAAVALVGFVAVLRYSRPVGVSHQAPAVAEPNEVEA